jgi:hypothetical protein
VNIYAYTVYVKQRAEKQHVRNLPRHSRSEGQQVRWPARIQKCPLFSLSSLVKIVGKATIYLEICLFSKEYASILHMCVSNYESNETQTFLIHIR